jgi:predicted lipoprotein with Yx(FWY)xxD motif
VSSVFRALLSTAAVVAISAYGSMAAAQAPVKAPDGVLTTATGMTLYTFDKDTADKSACTGTCATNWPPLIAAADAKPRDDWTFVTREDGAKQWVFKGKPVYTWSKDAKAGDKTGDNFNNLWHVAKDTAADAHQDDEIVVTGSRIKRHSGGTAGSVQSTDDRNAVGGIVQAPAPSIK